MTSQTKGYGTQVTVEAFGPLVQFLAAIFYIYNKVLCSETFKRRIAIDFSILLEKNNTEKNCKISKFVS